MFAGLPPPPPPSSSSSPYHHHYHHHHHHHSWLPILTKQGKTNKQRESTLSYHEIPAEK